MILNFTSRLILRDLLIMLVHVTMGDPFVWATFFLQNCSIAKLIFIFFTLTTIRNLCVYSSIIRFLRNDRE